MPDQESTGIFLPACHVFGDQKASAHITIVGKDCLCTKEDGRISYGMLIRATGNEQVPLVDVFPVLKSEALLIDFAYALGDARGGELPTTADVACLHGLCLARILNSNFSF